MGRVARAPGDGYTLNVGQLSTHVTNGVLYRLPYDLLKNFEPVPLVGSIPLVIAAKKRDAGERPKGISEQVNWARYEGPKTFGERMMALTAAQCIQISMVPIQNGG